jgi:clan AA aspartic protease
MGTFTVTIEIGDPGASIFESIEALVDTGATNTAVPAALLRRLGVAPQRKSGYRIADGSRLELDVGRTWVRVDGQQEFTQVVFGPEGSRPVLGAVTLEEMGLSVDPVARRLVPVDKYLL